MDGLSIEEVFVTGSNNCCTTNINDTKPMIVRGVTSKTEIDICVKNNRDYYYIDTGYVGNFPSKGNSSGKKYWHRVVKNNLQHDKIRDVPPDRWNRLVENDERLRWTGWKDYDKKILLVLPNPKATKFYNVDCDQWIQNTTEQIRTYSNLPIEIRVKGSRSERNHGYSIYSAFDSGVYATVSFNSIASLESVLYGIPSFVTVPCASTPLSSTDLSTLKNPYKPTMETILAQCYNIAYGQFTTNEFASGLAWTLINQYETTA